MRVNDRIVKQLGERKDRKKRKAKSSGEFQPRLEKLEDRAFPLNLLSAGGMAAAAGTAAMAAHVGQPEPPPAKPKRSHGFGTAAEFGEMETERSGSKFSQWAGDDFWRGWLDHDCGDFPNWVNETREYLDDPAHSDVNVIIWSWGGQVSARSEQELIDSYLAPMAQLEQD